jgi:predicted nucleic acid-binding Zn ribbon protein
VKSLSSIISALRTEGRISDAGSLAVIAKAWAGAAGDGLAGMTRPESLGGGVLRVRCAHPAAVMEIRMREKEIVASLNRAMGRDAVAKLLPSRRGRDV